MNKRMALCFIALLLPVFAAAACGGGQSNANAPSNAAASASSDADASAAATPAGSGAPAASASVAAAASSAPAAPAGPPAAGDWAKWTHEQKLAYMKSDVMPKMGSLFHEFDAKKYDEPTCMLCHGDGVKDGSFTMPNPGLPKLEATPAAMKAVSAKHPKVAAFMMKQVVPTMTQLLAIPAYDPKTHEGFGCFNCHTKK
jgi:hypothetical protein